MLGMGNWNRLSRLIAISVCIGIIAISMMSLPAQAEQPQFNLQAKSALLMEASTGEIIFAKNENEKLPPASITKIMTLLLIMEALDVGRANLQDMVVTSENAWKMGGSQIWLEPGEEMTLEHMLKAIAVVSANDACVAVGEYLDGTEDAFVRRMNERAKELGMVNTFFYNTNGLPPSDPKVQGNYTTAKDIALMSRELLKHPSVLEYTSIWMDTLRGGETGLTNTNKLVRHFPGVDGLKTGFTNEAKYCLSATGVRNNLRFISVVMGAPTSGVRFKEVSDLLSYGWSVFTTQDVVLKDQVVQNAKVSRGKVEEVPLVATEDFRVPLRKGTSVDLTTEIYLSKKIIAPIKAGDVLGEYVIKKDGIELGRVPLKAQNDVERGSIFQIIWQMFKNLFAGLANIFR